MPIIFLHILWFINSVLFTKRSFQKQNHKQAVVYQNKSTANRNHEHASVFIQPIVQYKRYAIIILTAKDRVRTSALKMHSLWQYKKIIYWAQPYKMK